MLLYTNLDFCPSLDCCKRVHSLVNKIVLSSILGLDSSKSIHWFGERDKQHLKDQLTKNQLKQYVLAWTMEWEQSNPIDFTKFNSKFPQLTTTDSWRKYKIQDLKIWGSWLPDLKIYCKWEVNYLYPINETYILKIVSLPNINFDAWNI